MSTLLIDELYDGVAFSQNIKIEENINVAYVRLWIFKEGVLQDGDLTLNIKNGATVLKTVTIPYTEINAAIPATYAHGYIRFDIEGLPLFVAPGNSEQEYTLEFYMDNHTTDGINYVAVSREFDVKKYEYYGATYQDSIASAGIEIYTYRSL